MIDALLGLVAPHHCYACGESGSILCDSCYNDIIESDFGRCIWCLRPAQSGNHCRACAHRYGLTGVWVVGERVGILKRLVGDYKYESTRESGDIMVKMLDQRVAILPKNTIVTAVPTVSRHIRQRGFDHAAALAQGFALRRKLAYIPLFKRISQQSQHELSGVARFAAATAAFGLKQQPQKQPVLLIDDIITTGATLQACTRLMRESGVDEVYVAVVARQMQK